MNDNVFMYVCVCPLAQLLVSNAQIISHSSNACRKYVWIVSCNLWMLAIRKHLFCLLCWLLYCFALFLFLFYFFVGLQVVLLLFLLSYFFSSFYFKWCDRQWVGVIIIYCCLFTQNLRIEMPGRMMNTFFAIFLRLLN